MKLIRNIQPILGLDIGTTAVKVVLLKEGVGGGVSLIDYRIEEFPLSADKKENIPLELVLETLRKTLSGINIKRVKVVTVVSGQRVSVRKVLVPNMPKEELLEAIKWEAKEHIPFPIENAVVDYHIIGEVADKGAKKLELLVVAVEKIIVDQHLGLLQNVQVKPACITVTPFALSNILKKNDYLKTGEIIAVVNTGAEATTINIFAGENLVFNREIPLGGNTITRAMVGTLISDTGQVELDINQAEILKKDWGIPDERNPQQLTPELNSAQVVPLIRPVLERLANEIRRSLDYYREESRGKRVSKVVLLGGGGELKGLPEFLTQAFGLAVEVSRSLNNLQIELAEDRKQELEQLSPRLSIAIGAALSGSKGLNLLPPELKEQATKTARSALTAVIIFLITLIFGLVYVSVYSQLMTYRKLRVASQNSLAELKRQVSQAYELQLLKEKMTARKNLISLIMLGDPKWIGILKTISNLTPEGIILEEVNFAKEPEQNLGLSAFNASPEGGAETSITVVKLPALSIRGMVMLGKERPEAILARFMQALEKTIYFNEMDLNSLQKEQQVEGQSKNFVTFEISCKLKNNNGGAR